MSKVKTYNSKSVMISLGNHAVSGLADDSFVTIDPVGSGVLSKSGCDGEVARAVDPNSQYTVKISLLQTSDSNKWLQKQHSKDMDTGDGTFPIMVKDIKGGMLFQSDTAWVTKTTSRQYGKDTNNREWEIVTGPAELKEE